VVLRFLCPNIFDTVSIALHSSASPSSQSVFAKCRQVLLYPHTSISLSDNVHLLISRTGKTFLIWLQCCVCIYWQASTLPAKVVSSTVFPVSHVWWTHLSPSWPYISSGVNFWTHVPNPVYNKTRIQSLTWLPCDLEMLVAIAFNSSALRKASLLLLSILKSTNGFSHHPFFTQIWTIFLKFVKYLIALLYYTCEYLQPKFIIVINLKSGFLIGIFPSCTSALRSSRVLENLYLLRLRCDTLCPLIDVLANYVPQTHHTTDPFWPCEHLSIVMQIFCVQSNPIEATSSDLTSFRFERSQYIIRNISLSRLTITPSGCLDHSSI